jgi:hypothetical protein
MWMKRWLLSVTIAPALAATAPADAAPTRHHTAKPAPHRAPVRNEPSGQIACTVLGCQRIPAHCRPQTGYDLDGVPTGYDVIICP